MFIWNELFFRPIYNLLFYVIDILPNHSLGLGIIIVTIIIKTLVLIPSQKALRSQKAMQAIQPEMEALKKKYQKDPQKQAQALMELYKKHGVNPLGSCLPMLLQFPLLIALFFVFRDAIDPENTKLLYQSLQGFQFDDINTMFLGAFDLATKNSFSKYVMPIIVGVLQFGQMYRMQMVKSNTPPSNTGKDGPQMNPADMQKMMMYTMPVLIAFFAASYPAALSLYWAVSTLYTIVQQEVLLSIKN